MATADDLSSFYMDFHPYNDGNNPNHTPGSDSQTLNYLKIGKYGMNPAKMDLLERIFDWLEKVLDNPDIVTAMAPGHLPGPPQNFLVDTVGKVIRSKRMEDGRELLIRTREVPKAAYGGPRDQSLHEETIEVKDPSKVKDKVVYIIDDIWTTGSTLRACASLMRKAGASDVKLLAVGKTVSM